MKAVRDKRSPSSPRNAAGGAFAGLARKKRSLRAGRGASPPVASGGRGEDRAASRRCRRGQRRHSSPQASPTTPPPSSSVGRNSEWGDARANGRLRGSQSVGGGGIVGSADALKPRALRAASLPRRRAIPLSPASSSPSSQPSSSGLQTSPRKASTHRLERRCAPNPLTTSSFVPFAPSPHDPAPGVSTSSAEAMPLLPLGAARPQESSLLSDAGGAADRPCTPPSAHRTRDRRSPQPSRSPVPPHRSLDHAEIAPSPNLFFEDSDEEDKLERKRKLEDYRRPAPRTRQREHDESSHRRLRILQARVPAQGVQGDGWSRTPPEGI
mmetsp:Transcript_26906/g.78350  ORF Transcript_26906/g.78350 Transcript_26906/m.78350 type:complete len:325 (-) Transcript_26906:158-1132(-)